jgi:luciferase family oxidoreductase group 1
MSNDPQNISYSILDVAPVVKGSNAAETFKKSLDLARQTERMSYHRFWLAEHHNMLHIASAATSVLIGHIAGGTKRIRVGSGGVMLPNHSPLIVAEQFATLALLYPGRIDLGLGRAPGTDTDTAFAIRAERMKSVYQFPDEVKRIQQYLSVENSDAKVRVPFAEGINLPVYILGSSTDSAHVAAQLGLPYAFASHFAPAQLKQALNIYYNEFQPSAVLQQPYSIAGINVIAADTDAEAEKIASSLLFLFVNILSGKQEYLQEPVELVDEVRSLWHHPSVQQMLKYTFIGSKQTVKEKTEEFLAATGVNELMVVTNTFHHEDRIRSYQIFSELISEINKSKKIQYSSVTTDTFK